MRGRHGDTWLKSTHGLKDDSIAPATNRSVKETFVAGSIHWRDGKRYLVIRGVRHALTNEYIAKLTFSSLFEDPEKFYWTKVDDRTYAFGSMLHKWLIRVEGKHIRMLARHRFTKQITSDMHFDVIRDSTDHAFLCRQIPDTSLRTVDMDAVLKKMGIRNKEN